MWEKTPAEMLAEQERAMKRISDVLTMQTQLGVLHAVTLEQIEQYNP
jgi:hypothetical protein